MWFFFNTFAVGYILKVFYMEEVYISLANLEKKLTLLVKELHIKRGVIDSLEFENQELRGKIEQLQMTLERQEYKNTALQLLISSKVLQGEENTEEVLESVDLKLKLNTLIKDITYCINYLKKNE